MVAVLPTLWWHCICCSRVIQSCLIFNFEMCHCRGMLDLPVVQTPILLMLFYCLTQLLTWWSRVPLEKSIVAWKVKFSIFYGTWKFVILLAQVPTGPFPELDQSIPHPPILFFKIIFNILPLMYRYSKWPLCLKVPHENSVRICHFTGMCHMPHPLMPPNLIICIICGKEYKSYSF